MKAISLAFAVVLAAASAAIAQQNQPIYPVYDGYIKNPDGSYTLSFAYFSHNADTITIAPGANNAFGPAPGDRLQPTVDLELREYVLRVVSDRRR